MRPPQPKTPLFLGQCTYRNCPFCGRDFFKWYAGRMDQMHTVQKNKGMTTSFADAAATSIRPPRPVPLNAGPGTRVKVARGVQADTDWGQTGVIVHNNEFVAGDGVHRILVQFTSTTRSWEWYFDINDLALAD